MTSIKKKFTNAPISKVLCISIYEEMSSHIAEIAKELNIQVEIYDGGILSDGHCYAQKVQDQCDVIISQAGTATVIQNMVKTPFITINITAIDIINAFKQALQINQNVTFVCHQGSLVSEVSAMAKLFLPHKFTALTYTSKKEFEECIAKMIKNKNHIVMGFGGCIVEITEKYKIPYVLIKSSRDSIYQALLSAKNIIEKNTHEKRRARRLQNLINHNREGIISIDNKQMVTICNAEAQRLLKLKNVSVLGTHVHKKGSPESLRTLYGNGKFILNNLLDVGGKEYIVSRIPVIVRSHVQETVITFQALQQIQKVEAQARAKIHCRGLIARYSFDDIICGSENMKHMLDTAKQYASTHANIFVDGETGTGKEVIAQSIHQSSPRRKGPFVAINCAALPGHLLESELFGYEEGAFTGAKKGGKRGLFELAHKGTIFLDEVGEIPLDIQGKLLRVLQEKEVFRLGGDKVTNVDVRVVSATNKNLFAMAEENTFRRDLLFRLNLLPISIPSLRERTDDIPLLMQHFIKKYGESYGTMPPNPSRATYEAFKAYHWPGNIRELMNLMERTCIVYQAQQNIDVLLLQLFEEHKDIATRFQKTHNGAQDSQLNIACGTLKEMESAILREYFKKADGKTQKMADMLGLSRVTVWKKMKDLHLNVQ